MAPGIGMLYYTSFLSLCLESILKSFELSEGEKNGKL
jgi:hypothetical protein